MFAAPVLLALATQFTQGPADFVSACDSIVGGGPPVRMLTVSAAVGTFKNTAQQLPKQGDAFTVFINVQSYSQPCATHLTVRPGVKLPPALQFIPRVTQNDPAVRCFMGVPGTNPTSVPCPAGPTEVRADGTLMFDRPGGFWSIPDGQMLQIQVPVRGSYIGTQNLTGFVDYTPFVAGQFFPLQPTVPVDVFFNPPVINRLFPEAEDVGPYSATLLGQVEPHFNAGIVRLELARGNLPFAVVEQAELGGDLFVADVDLLVEGLDADTDYRARWTYEVPALGFEVTGPTINFRTDPAPRFALTRSVTGEGSIVASTNVTDLVIDRSVVTFTAAAAPGHRVESFRVNGELVSGDRVTVTVSGPIALDAVFVEAPVEEVAEEPAADEGDEVVAPEAPVNDTTTEEPVTTDDTNDGGAEAPTAGDEEGIHANEPAPSAGGEGPALGDDDRVIEADETTEDAGGCASTKPAGLPLLLAALVLFRRRRR